MWKEKINPTIVTFGEIMLRLMPYNFERFTQAHSFHVTYGGGEANVATSLANYGDDSWFVTVLPNNSLGQAAFNQLRGYGVHTDYIVRKGDRLGIYFIEQGASIRPSRVIYDRSHSSIAVASPDTFSWPEIFKEKSWFHVTGITPALSSSCAQMTLDAAETAKKMGLIVSCDLNYREKLWSREEAQKIMTKLVQNVDIIIANEADCSDIFGIETETTHVESGHLDINHYKSIASHMMDLANAKFVAITLRESLSASDNNWSAMMYDGTDFYVSRKYKIHLVDRVGAGDSFGAGLIHALIHGKNIKDALEFAVAASALKQTIVGDMNLVYENEVMEIVKGNLSGRVQR